MDICPKTADEVRPLVLEGIAIFGRFLPGTADWLTPYVLANAQLGDWNTYKALVRGGEPVPNEDKAAIGLPGWFEIGRPCWDRMTEAGRRDPKEAVNQLLQHVFWRWRLSHRRAQFADFLRSGPSSGRPLYPEVAIHADELCCSAAQAINGKSYPWKDYPDLPLPNCDQVWCKCDWKSVRRTRPSR